MLRRLPSHRPPGRRPAWGWTLVLALLLQWLAASYFSTAMAFGAEICSSSGSEAARVDGSGKTLPSAGHHAGHDCCCTATLFLPPAVVAVDAIGSLQAGPSEALAPGHLGAEWLGPLSRGPPAGAPR